jgi:Protein of unknown function (DUF3606)
LWWQPKDGRNGVPRTDRDEVTQLSRLVDQAAWNAWKAWAKLQDAESRRAAPSATTGPICAQEGVMAKKTARGRKQDRARVAGKQDYEVKYEAKKTGKSKAKVKRAVKKAGPSRKKVERALGRS